jgi:hypothetical protein
MHAASLELCRELYELSGWGGGQVYDGVYAAHPDVKREGDRRPFIPAYDLGYLLRKLQESAPTLAWMYDEQKWAMITDASFERQDAVTPEDAACKLAIELFKQGILTKEQPHD